MADDKLVQILKHHGAAQWNIWRKQNTYKIDLTGAPLSHVNLRNTNLEGADLTNAAMNNTQLQGAILTGANLTGADLTKADLTRVDLTEAALTEAALIGAVLMRVDLTEADLTKADLTGADLTEADLTKADLTGADLRGVDLRGAKLISANLTDANLTDANLSGTKFSHAIVTPGTQGLKVLTENQYAEIRLVVEGDEAKKSLEGTVPQEASPPGNVTIDHATSIVGPASAILEYLPIPNDPNFTKEHHDLLRELQRIVNELNAELGKVEDQERRLSEEPAILKLVQEGIPVWRQTWLTFVASAAGVVVGSAAGQGAAFSAGYMAGFIAGVLHDSFSPSADCLI